MKTKKQRKQFLNDNFKLSTLNFKCSRNYVVRIYNLRGEKTEFYAGGGGYDKQGTCLGQLINHYFNNEIKKLNTSDFYGLTHWNKKTKKHQKRSSKNTKSYVNGACGFNSMQKILNKIGFKLQFVYESNNSTMYKMSVK